VNVGRREAPSTSADGRGLLVVGGQSDAGQEIRRLAASTGIATQGIESAELTEAIWSRSGLVLVDAGCAEAVRSAALSRRPGVLLAATRPPGPEVWSAAVAIGVEQVLELPAEQPRLLDRLTEVANGPGPLGILVAVAGGCGGAGASTLAVALALSAAKSGQQPVLIGADPWDGGIDVTLGAEDVPGPRWPDLAGVSGRLSSEAILDGLPSAHGVRFLSSARARPSTVPAPALSAVVTAARRTGGPVVVDLPRGGAESGRWLGGLVDLGVVVCPATVSGALATRALVTESGWTAPSFRIVVRNGVGGRDIDRAALAAAVGIPVILALREDSHLSRQRRRGEPPQPRRRSNLAKSCAVLWQLAADRAEQAR